MLVTFRCHSYSSVTMFGDIALQLIKMMGHSETVPGSLAAKDVPDALDSLMASLAKQAVQESSSNNDENSDDDEQTEPNVGLNHRAYPLIELLKSAIKNDDDVMWEE
ncbi:DUF1840 domain-containing protein [Vibrio olivae]|uniref:DUF1840 domain-containing protein n=1 Tax=Vibrio olivae TaxID=1243002 RepID=A0ABV5HQU7_9VIBR